MNNNLASIPEFCRSQILSLFFLLAKMEKMSSEPILNNNRMGVLNNNCLGVLGEGGLKELCT